jgi:hypothetical protein
MQVSAVVFHLGGVAKRISAMQIATLSSAMLKTV